MGIVRSIASASVAALVLASGVAAAQDNECVRLEARLASLERGDDGFGVGDYQKHDAAVARQRDQLERATGQARAAGCIGGFILFQNRRNPRCGQMMASIDRMRANLSRLSAARDRAGRGGFGFGAERERSEVLRALALNQCGPQYAAFGRRSLFQTLFGGQRDWGDDGLFPGNDQFGTYRTLCVRTCDGYYFPISFSTVQAKFAQDQEVCQSMCPGTDVALYIHRNPGEESEAMVSLAGEPYTALPAAFKYRKEYDKACACGTPTAIAAASGAAAAGGMTPIDPSLFARPAPLPRASPSRSEDPETLANRAGDFVPKPAEFHEPPPAPVAGLSASGKPVRIVGPSYIVTQ